MSFFDGFINFGTDGDLPSRGKIVPRNFEAVGDSLSRSETVQKSGVVVHEAYADALTASNATIEELRSRVLQIGSEHDDRRTSYLQQDNVLKQSRPRYSDLHTRRDILRAMSGKRFPESLFTGQLSEIVPGMTFVLSGEFLWYGGRSLIERAINMAGCVVRSSVSGSTTAVVLGTAVSDDYSPGTYGSKVAKACDLNATKGKHIGIIGERDFLKLLIASSAEVRRYLSINKAMIKRFWDDASAGVVVPDGHFTNDQMNFVRAVSSGRNVWLAGQAGTGKSYVIDAVVRRLSRQKHVAVAAPTGIAALNVDGVTLHSLLRMQPGGEFDERYLQRLQRNNYLAGYDVVVVDEISMCSIATFDVFGIAVSYANRERAENGKLPVQVVVVGDFGQLPPVVTKDESKMFAQHYGFEMPSWYCFLSEYWQKFDFCKVELTQSIRQRDSYFVAALNSIRVGDYVSLKWVELSMASRPDGDAVVICGTNEDANRINSAHLRSLAGREFVFDADVDGDVEFNELSIDEYVVLKRGARVMATKNGRGYANGSMGYVESLTDEYAVVRFDDGRSITISPDEWLIRKPLLQNGVWRVCTVGRVQQIPLKVAKAITCHKSQGKTFDAVNILPSFWDNGQMYTAISRAKSVDGIFVYDGFKGHAFVTSDVVIDFMSGMTREQIIAKRTRLKESVREYRGFKQKKKQTSTKGRGSSGNRPVEMLADDGHVLKSFNSIAAAARMVGCDSSSIRRVLNHPTHRAANHRWRDKV